MKYVMIALLIMLSTSCLPDNNTQVAEPIDFSVQNEEEITTFITANNLTAQRSSSGLYYVIDEPGTGTQPNTNSTVTVAYRGYFTDGRVFDQSGPDGISFGLQQVIPGWTEGITYFKEGGSGILLIPASLGYGSRDSNGIPGGSVLLFDINLIEAN